MKHSKTDPSLSSYQLAHIMHSNTNDPNAVKPGSIESSKTFGSTRAMNIQWPHYQYPQHHHQQQPLYYYNPPNSVDSAAAGGNNNNNNRLIYRQQFPNSSYAHPYMAPYHIGHAGQVPSSSAASSSSIMHRHHRGRFLTSYSANEPQHQQQQLGESGIGVAELSEETILNKEHNEILAKLNFVLALVDSLFELINSLASPLNMLSESISGIEKSGDINVSFMVEVMMKQI